MKQSWSGFVPGVALFILVAFVVTGKLFSQESVSGEINQITFSKQSLPPTLYSLMTGQDVSPVLEYSLPDNYSPDETYPLMVYVPGNNGGFKGTLDNAITIAGDHDWITASLPLFKSDIDRNEVNDGILMSLENYPALSSAYSTMLSELFKQIPNIDTEKS